MYICYVNKMKRCLDVRPDDCYQLTCEGDIGYRTCNILFLTAWVQVSIFSLESLAF